MSLEGEARPVEAGNKPDTQMVLEIGFGMRLYAACNNGGRLFSDPNIRYVGIDSPYVFMNSRPSKKQSLRESELKNAFTAMDTAALQFPDDSFDIVLMRNKFGQFKNPPQFWRSNIVNFEHGLYEIFRVLKPGGKIVIAEEETPQESDKVEYDLRNTGFKPLDYALMRKPYTETGPDDKWLRLRKEFYGDRPIQQEPDWMRGTPYLLICQKPEHPVYEIFDGEIEIETDIRVKQKIKLTYKKGIQKFPSIIPDSFWP